MRATKLTNEFTPKPVAKALDGDVGAGPEAADCDVGRTDIAAVGPTGGRGVQTVGLVLGKGGDGVDSWLIPSGVLGGLAGVWGTATVGEGDLHESMEGIFFTFIKGKVFPS